MKQQRHRLTDPEMTIQNTVHKYILNCSKENRLAFVSAAIFTFFTHLFYFTGRFANEDDLHWHTPPQWNLSLGRWADGFKLVTDVPLPAMLFIAVIISLSAVTCITVSILELKKPTSIVLAAMLLSSFPTLAYSFGYLYGVEQYALALLFAALSVWVTKRYKWGFFPGAFLLAYSLGQYQSYVAYAMALALMTLLLDLLERKTQLKDWMISAGKYLLMGITGGLLYLIVLKFFLVMTGVQLGEYKGLNSMGRIPPASFGPLLLRTYRHVADFLCGRYFFGFTAAQIILHWICIALLLILIVHYIFYHKIYLEKCKLFLISLLLLLFPLCVNAVDMLAPQASASPLNIYAFSLIFIFPLALWEKAAWYNTPALPKAKKAALFLSWAIALSTLSVSWGFILHSNLYYSKISIYYEYTISFYNRLLARIEQSPGYNVEMPIAIMSDRTVLPYGDETQVYKDKILYDQGLWGKFMGLNHGKGEEWTVTQKSLALIRNSLGVPLHGATKNQIEQIKASPEYKAMGVWPSTDGIAQINGICVINFLVEQEATIEYQNNTLSMDVIIDKERYPQALYAWSLYKDETLIRSQNYGAQSSFQFVPTEAGEYYGRYSVKIDSNIWKDVTSKIIIPQSPSFH